MFGVRDANITYHYNHSNLWGRGGRLIDLIFSPIFAMKLPHLKVEYLKLYSLVYLLPIG